MTNKELKRVVVTGMGAITPIGNTLSEYWDGLLNGKSGVDKITLFDSSKHKCCIAAEVKGFDPLEHYCRYVILSNTAVMQALYLLNIIAVT